jgi:F-type H+-transporting ATPase subunit epsilon
MVVTPEKAFLDEKAEYVGLPMYDGDLGVLPGRAPLIGRLSCGELRLRKEGRTRRYFVDGGFAEVKANVVTVLTSKVLEPKDIDVNAAKRTLVETTALARTPEEQETHLRAAERARAQLRVAKAGGPQQPATPEQQT